LKQLTFYGKKTVPAEIRKDVWRPYATVAFPIPRIEAEIPWAPLINVEETTREIKYSTRRFAQDPLHLSQIIIATKDLNEANEKVLNLMENLQIDTKTRLQTGVQDKTKLGALQVDKLAEFAYRKLLHLRMLRDYAWKEDGGPVAVSEDRRKRVDEPPMFEQVLSNRRSYKRREGKKDLKERQQHLMDQRGSSVADISTAIDHVNSYLLEKINLANTRPSQRGLNFRVQTPWRKNRRFVYSHFIKHRFQQLEQWSAQANPTSLKRMQQEIDALTSKLTKTSTIKERTTITKLRQKRNNILRARLAVQTLGNTIPKSAFSHVSPALSKECAKHTLSIPWWHLIKDIRALYSQNLSTGNAWTAKTLETNLPVHIYWADLFNRKYTDTWAANILHHWMGPKTGADLVRAAVPNFEPDHLLEMEPSHNAANQRSVQVETDKKELKLMNHEKQQVRVQLDRLLPWFLYLREAKSDLEKELVTYQTSTDGDISNLYATNQRELKKVSQELQVQQRASNVAKHDPERRKNINHQIFVLTRARDSLARSVARGNKWTASNQDSGLVLGFERAIEDELEKIRIWSVKAVEEKDALDVQLEAVESRITEYKTEKHSPIIRHIYRGNEGIDDEVLVDGKIPEDVENFGETSSPSGGLGVGLRRALPMPKVEEEVKKSGWLPKWSTPWKQQTAVTA
jgi:hypothetical protein